MKSMFARHGVPETVVSDNGPQYSSREFALFANDYGFQHVTSSPEHSSGNGEAERAVGTIKELLKPHDQDPYAALMIYRATPRANGYSPAELLMNRKIRTLVPIVPQLLKSKVPDFDLIQEKEQSQRWKQKANFDKHRAARPLSQLGRGDEVYMKDRREDGTVYNQVTDRSYIISTPSGSYRRNRIHLNKLPEYSDPDERVPQGEESQQQEPAPPDVKSTSQVQPPETSGSSMPLRRSSRQRFPRQILDI